MREDVGMRIEDVEVWTSVSAKDYARHRDYVKAEAREALQDELVYCGFARVDSDCVELFVYFRSVGWFARLTRRRNVAQVYSRVARDATCV